MPDVPLHVRDDSFLGQLRTAEGQRDALLGVIMMASGYEAARDEDKNITMTQILDRWKVRGYARQVVLDTMAQPPTGEQENYTVGTSCTNCGYGTGGVPHRVEIPKGMSTATALGRTECPRCGCRTLRRVGGSW